MQSEELEEVANSQGMINAMDWSLYMCNPENIRNLIGGDL